MQLQASKLKHSELPHFLFLNLGARPAGEVGDGGMAEGWVGTGVEARGDGGGRGEGVGWAANSDGDTNPKLPRSVILMVGNWELRLTWDEVRVTG